MNGRAQSHEAAPYYFTYINEVKGDDAVGAVEKQLDESLMPVYSNVAADFLPSRYSDFHTTHSADA